MDQRKGRLDVNDVSARLYPPKMTNRKDRARGQVRGSGGKFAAVDLPETLRCSIPGCPSPVQVKARGWCEKHYTRWKRHGDPLITYRRRYQPAGEKIRQRDANSDELLREAVRHIAPDGSSSVELAAARVLAKRGKMVSVVASGCWHWRGALHQGYGHIMVDGRRQPAHRWLWEQVHGPLPSTLHVDHMCHNEDPTCDRGADCPHRGCVNPLHLAPATPRENSLRGKSIWAKFAARDRCNRGHLFDAENTAWRSRRGRRDVRECRKCTVARTTRPRTGDRSKGRVRDDERVTISALRAKGLSYRAIAAEIGRCDLTVAKVVKEMSR